jgi:DNA-binding MarR family transcriptional regulator
MSSLPGGLDFLPFIAVVHRTNKALQTDMVEEAHRQGQLGIKQAHNAVFGTLHEEGMRAVDMAAQMGMTRQSMGEIIRDMVGLGILEMVPDPTDGRAKLVRFSEHGRDVAAQGFAHIRELEDRFVKEFGRKDWATARRVLRRVAEMLEADNAPNDPEPSTPTARVS